MTICVIKSLSKGRIMKHIINFYFGITFWTVLSNISIQFYLYSGTNVTSSFIKLYKLLLFLLCLILARYICILIQKGLAKEIYIFVLLLGTTLYFYKDIFSKIQVETSLGGLSIALIYGFVIIPFTFVSTNRFFKYLQKS